MSEDLTFGGNKNDQTELSTLILTTIIIGILFVVSTLSAETPEPYKLDNGLTIILRSCTYGKQSRFCGAIQYR